MIPVAIAGACGRMGRRIIEVFQTDPTVEVVGGWERPDHPEVGSEVLGIRVEGNPKKALERARVMVDFTRPEATLEHLKIAVEMKVSAVVGTTGFSQPPEELLRPFARKIPLFYSPNMSPGIQILRLLLREALPFLQGYDCEMIELHHRYKEDAPSGTALKLLDEVLIQRSLPLSEVRFGRGKGKFPRSPSEVGVHAIRAGEIVGDHWIIFAGQGERIEFIHRALNRDPFVYGALRAVRFIAEKPPGLYGMEDLFSFKG
jgi:4-hydroxy-tetrahydrodipicolinate reductase